MATDPETTPPIRRGKGLRLSTESRQQDETPAEPHSSPAESAPVSRRRGLRLSTQPPGAEPEAAPVDDVPVQGAAPPPAQASPTARLRITTAGGPISYLKSGEGAPLLLIHGFGASARIWGQSLLALADLRTVYALDLPGFGESPQRASAPTLAGLAAEVLAFADALNLERFDLVGHSLGAAVAALIAARQPRRVGRLVTVSLAARLFAPDLAALSLSRAPFDLSLGLARPMLNFWQPLGRLMMQSPPMAMTMGSMVLNGQPASAELWQGYLSDHAVADPRAYLTWLTASGDPLLHEALRRIVAPTLCVAGNADRVARLNETLAAQELVDGSRLVVLEGCGHVPMIEQPAAFNEAVRRFLAG